MRTLLQDLRYAVRMLLKNPVITSIAILTLALGIGANTAIFSVMNALVLRMLPVADPSRLALFGNGDSMGSTDGFPNRDTTLFSYPMFRELQRNNRVFSDVAAIKSLTMTVHGRVTGGRELEKMEIRLVSGSYFPVLGLVPQAGRLFTDSDDQMPGGHAIAVASDSWWTRRFANEPFALGKTIKIGATVYDVVGVTPPKFFGTTVGECPDFWIPLAMEAQVSPGWNGLTNRFFQSLHVIGRMNPRVDLARAEADINLVFKRTLLDYAGPQPTKKDLEDLQHARIGLTPAATGLSQLREQFSKPLHILMSVVAMVLLIACANIANLMLARAMARQREIAVRMAVGATRWRLIRQLLSESLLLSLLGGALGLAMAQWAARLLLMMVSNGPQPVPVAVTLDFWVLAFTSIIAVVTALIFGIAPAFRAAQVECGLELKEGKASAPSQARRVLARTLLVGQVALSLALLTGAGLFLRTLVNLTSMDMGFQKENVLLFQIDESSAGYKEDPRLLTLYQEIERRVSALPGIQAASFSFFTFNQGGWTTFINTAKPLESGDRIVSHNVVGPAYFATMGIPLLAGRTFGTQDTETSSKVAVVNETLAKRYFPGQSPIGQRFRIGGPDAGPESEREVIGIVKDAKYFNLRETVQAAAYYPYSQKIQYLGDFEIRFSGAPAAAISAVRATVARVDPNLSISDVRTLTQQIERSIVDQRLIARISGFFALVALFLACIGIYGVTSYAVTQQTREIGIRMALGAQRKQVLSLILRQTLVVLAAGVVIGVPAVLATQRLIATQLYGLPPIDPVSISLAAALLIGAAILAGYLPARQATKVDPMEALRYE